MQYFESIAILIAKSQSIAISIAKFQKYCNTLQFYWKHPCVVYYWCVYQKSICTLFTLEKLALIDVSGSFSFFRKKKRLKYRYRVVWLRSNCHTFSSFIIDCMFIVILLLFFLWIFILVLIVNHLSFEDKRNTE